MTRRAVTVDRIAVLLLGAGLLALGLAAVAWQRGALRQARPLDLSTAAELAGTPWWPWSSGAAGIVLVLLALRWLFSHHPAPRVTRLGLADGRTADNVGLTADASSVAQVAAATLTEHSNVIKATGRAAAEHGSPTITLTVTVPARSPLDAGVTAATDIVGTIAHMLGDTVSVRTVLRADSRTRRRTPL
jgi:hypothetical protein